jgi:hypothetical protein
MGVVISPDSTYGKELAKWNVKKPFTRFPAMVYRAMRRDDGVPTTGGTAFWDQKCQLTVNDERELQRAYEGGWRDSPAEALEHFKSRENVKGEVAAIRAYEDRNMSDAAKTEAKAFESGSVEHAPEIPRAPKKGRRRRIDEE